MLLGEWLTEKNVEVLARRESEERWLALRNEGITATDIPILMGASKWKTPLDLYLIKKGIKTDEISVGNADKVWFGNISEPHLMSRFNEEAGLPAVECNGLLAHGDMPWLRVTPDAFVLDGNSIPIGLLEIKTTGMGQDWAGGEPPPYVWWQVQAQMAVVPVERAWVAALLFGFAGIDKFIWMEVERDAAAIDRLIGVASRFNERLLNDDPPDPQVDDAANLQLLHPQEGPQTISGEAHYDDLDAQRQEAKEQMKELKAKVDAIDVTLKHAIGDNLGLALPSGVTYTWKTTKRKGYVVEAKEFRQLRRKGAK